MVSQDSLNITKERNMGSKSGGGGDTYNTERPQSAEELRLLDSQGAALDAGIAIAAEQEARAAEGYQSWVDSYEPIGTGMIDNNATRENGYTNGMNGKYEPAPTVAQRREGATYNGSVPQTSSTKGV